MTEARTISGLRDTLEDLDTQLEKAADKHESLRRRTDAVRDAQSILGQSASVDTNTIEGLKEDLEELEKQLEKAAKKHDTLRRRTDAVRDALQTLQQ